MMGGLAPGAPGIAPTWCSSDKDFVTTALGASRVWATVGHGIVNEVYWPSTGAPQIRDFSFYLVGATGWIDLKRVRRYHLSTPGPYLPAPTITHYGDDYQLALELLPDPRRDVLLLRFKLDGPYRLVVLLAPHLGSNGRDNFAWIDRDEGYARRHGASICLAADPPLAHLSCGYVGASDGWQDLNRHGALTFDYTYADNGTVALTGEAVGNAGVLALGFSESPRGALTFVRTALAEGFETLRGEFLQAWHEWGAQLQLPRPSEILGNAGLLSAAVLKIHEDRSYPGAVVASLSVPWGNSTDTLGGYHLVWPRDATLTAFALLAADQRADVRRMLGHLAATQVADGHWPQNYFPSGEPFWTGTQLDEAAFPVLLAAKLRELGEGEVARHRRDGARRDWIHRPHGSRERARSLGGESWRQSRSRSRLRSAHSLPARPGFTTAERAYAESLADDWNERLEGWCHVLVPARAGSGRRRLLRAHRSRPQIRRTGRTVQLRNRDGELILATALVSIDFSYLVRLGLRNARDLRVQDTITVVDKVLRINTPSGPLYHRYNEDGYGEHADGQPFDGTGIGRAWPLLVGERGHLALQAGEDPISYLQTIWNCASQGGLLPEQVWDATAIPSLELTPGRPSGSAMPLLWAHAEFLKLLIARESGRPIELLQAVEQRYPGGAPRPATAWHWRDEVPVVRLEQGRSVADRGPPALHSALGFRRVAAHPGS